MYCFLKLVNAFYDEISAIIFFKFVSNLHTNVLLFTVKMTLQMKYYSNFIIAS